MCTLKIFDTILLNRDPKETVEELNQTPFAQTPQKVSFDYNFTPCFFGAWHCSSSFQNFCLGMDSKLWIMFTFTPPTGLCVAESETLPTWYLPSLPPFSSFPSLSSFPSFSSIIFIEKKYHLYFSIVFKLSEKKETVEMCANIFPFEKTATGHRINFDTLLAVRVAKLREKVSEKELLEMNCNEALSGKTTKAFDPLEFKKERFAFLLSLPNPSSRLNSFFLDSTGSFCTRVLTPTWKFIFLSSTTSSSKVLLGILLSVDSTCLLCRNDYKTKRNWKISCYFPSFPATLILPKCGTSFGLKSRNCRSFPPLSFLAFLWFW